MNLRATYALLFTVLICCLSEVKAETIIIIESNSFHAMHTMDAEWVDQVEALGFVAQVAPQSALSDFNALNQADALVISSAMMDFSAEAVLNLEAYLATGKNIYIQGEFMPSFPGNKLFQSLVTYYEGTFNWEGSTTGVVAPLEVSGVIREYEHTTYSLDYFYFGAYGAGNQQITSFLTYNNLDYGFIFCPADPTIGKIVTCSDQDWVRQGWNDDLIQNIASFLVHEKSLQQIPTVYIESESEDLCPNQSATFYAYASNDQVSYQWYLNGEELVGEHGSSLSILNIEEGDEVSAQIFFQGTCNPIPAWSNTLELNLLTDSNVPSVFIEADTDEPCPNEPVSFTATASSDEVQFQWYLNGQPIGGETTDEFVLFNPQDGDVVECAVTQDGNCGLIEVMSNPILIAPIFPVALPQIEVDADQAEYCEGSAAVFTASLSSAEETSAHSYQWVLNDELVDGATELTFVLDQPAANDEVYCILGYANICDQLASTNSNIIAIQIAEPVLATVNVSADATEICPGEAVTLTASGTNWGTQPQFFWISEGDTLQVGGTTFATATLLEGQAVQVSVVPNLFCPAASVIESNEVSIAYTIVELATLEITADVTEGCVGSEVTYTATGANWGNEAQMEWFVNGQSIEETNASYIHVFQSESDLISFRLVADQVCGQAAPILAEAPAITELTSLNPSIEIEADYSQFCSNQIVTFASSGTDLEQATFEWFIDGYTTGIVSNIFDMTNFVEGQEVTCEVTIQDPCVGQVMVASNAIELTYDYIELEVLELQPEDCAQSNGLIEVAAFGGNEPYQFNWEDGAEGAYRTGLSAGTYQVIVIDATGCSQSLEVIIEDDSWTPEVAITPAHVACGRLGTLQAAVQSTEAYSAVWTDENGAVLSQNLTIVDLEVGAYFLELTSGAGCVYELSYQVEEEQLPELLILPQEPITKGSAAQLKVELTETNLEYTIQWIPVAGLECTSCLQPEVRPEQDAYYQVTIQFENGCVITEEVFVEVIDPISIVVPNAFTPNGDGNNDFLGPFGKAGIGMIKSLRVFDRWGNLLFSSRGTTLNAPETGWDGTVDGRKASTGVYTFAVEVSYQDGREDIVRGDVTLLR